MYSQLKACHKKSVSNIQFCPVKSSIITENEQEIVSSSLKERTNCFVQLCHAHEKGLFWLMRL